MKKFERRFAIPLCCLAGSLGVPLVLGQNAQQSCDNTLINGDYGYFATQSAGSSSSTTSGGTTGGTGSSGSTTGSGSSSGGTTGFGSSGSGSTSGGSSGATGSTSGSSSSTFSDTAVGQLLRGVSGGANFGSAGLLNFDGNGVVSAYPSLTSRATRPVGTYSVTPRCAITITLNDTFATSSSSSSGPGTAGATNGSASGTALAGAVLASGSEIDLSVPGMRTVRPRL